MNKTINIKINKQHLLEVLNSIKNFNNKIEHITIYWYDKVLAFMAQNINNYALGYVVIKDINETTAYGNSLYIKINYNQFLNALICTRNKATPSDDIFICIDNLGDNKLNIIIDGTVHITGELTKFINQLFKNYTGNRFFLNKDHLNKIKQHIMPFICKSRDFLTCYKTLNNILIERNKDNQLVIAACDMHRLALYNSNILDYEGLTDPTWIPSDLFDLLFKEKYNKTKISFYDNYIMCKDKNSCMLCGYEMYFFYKKINDDVYPVTGTEKFIDQYHTYNNHFIVDNNFINQLLLIKAYFISDHFITLKIMNSKLEISIKDTANKWEYNIINKTLNESPIKETIITVNYDTFIKTLKTFNKKHQINIWYNDTLDPLFINSYSEENILKIQLPIKLKNND